MPHTPGIPIQAAEFDVTGQVDDHGGVYVSIEIRELPSVGWSLGGVRAHMTLFSTTLAPMAPHLGWADANVSIGVICQRATEAWRHQVVNAEFRFEPCDRSPEGRDRGRLWRRCLRMTPGCTMPQVFHSLARDIIATAEMWPEDGEFTIPSPPHLSIESCQTANYPPMRPSQAEDLRREGTRCPE